MKLRIVHLNSSGVRGAIPNIISKIGKGSVHDHLLLTGSEESNSIQTHAIDSKFGYYKKITSARLFDIDGLYGRSVAENIYKGLSTLDPDLLHIHNIHGYWADFEAVVRFINKFKPKVVWTTHDEWLLTGRCCNILKCENQRIECRPCPDLKRYPKTFVDRAHRNFKEKERLLGLIQDDCIFVHPSEQIKAKFNHSHLRNLNQTVIHNGVEVEELASQAMSRPKKIRNLGLLANKWNAVKGFEDILRLRAALPSYININVLGASNSQIQFLSASKITALPRTNEQQDVKSFITQQDLIFVPSRHEAFGMVPLECVALNIPVFAYAIDTFSELYGGFDLIRLFDCYDLDAVIDKIINQDLSEFPSMERVSNLEKYSTRLMVKRYDQVYRSTLHEKND